ncbi:uncharacterized protein ColSpa_06525 [Colletotrichum spaethianum]|uniref:T6SS Phospholipase effector Tle1-like catalytic domain-containing protein n=1 Tax=Colletotrichum spaethianum TaxID=700344 RepID=A0AA37LF90_9PEZI|nr:uncharacterized protein ColSpa_06525 [Colletotrichum spaethianum]GKT46344.1 uncharacterized protein ColSpa_06525 [Colletotrichum spaethianum]
MPQIVYYHRGVGTAEDFKVVQYLGGVFGKGIVEDIKDVYRFVCDNYNPGDEIVILGFSRGAFTARSVSGLICNIGLLNRVGLSQFGAIFHDYQNFTSWNSNTKFNKEEHLVGFTLSNFARLEKFKKREGRSDAEMEAELDHEKNTFFHSMATCNDKGQGKLRKMAKTYVDILEKHEMVLFEKNPNFQYGLDMKRYIPAVIEVNAVGVWDTVGSLGWPKMPWEKIRRDRSADEV